MNSGKPDSDPTATADRNSLPRAAGARIAAFIRHDRAWLTFFVVVVLTLPIFLGYTSLRLPDFNEKPRQQLLEERPEILLVGDSMLGSRINATLLSQLSHRRVSTLVYYGSASGMWYLFVKNYVAALPAPRPRTVIFFRDRYLTDPTFRLKGRYLKDLHRVMHGNEPVIDQFIDRPSPGLVGWLHGKVMKLYPVTQLHDPVADSITETADVYTRRIFPSRTDLNDVLDHVFDIRRLRPDIPSDLASDNLDVRPFDASPASSFLPFIVKTARQNDIDLWFYRVKRRPNNGPVECKQSEALAAYIGSLDEWITAQGAHFVDETPDPRLTLALYGDGDHISAPQKDAYTRLFFEANRHLFE